MSKVIIKECSKYEVKRIMDAINQGMDLLGGWDLLLKPALKTSRPLKVLLKPNLISPRNSDSAAITHPEILRALIRILKERGCEVWIGDSTGGAIAGFAPTAQALKISGYEDVASEEGAKIKNFDKEGVVEVNKMYIAKPMFDADIIINVPKLKTHSMTMYTGAVKNLFGCISGLKKAEYHKAAPNPLDFGKVIAQIHLATRVNLHIMDGIVAMEGEGPTGGDPYPTGKILISQDPLALDVTAIQMIGMPLAQVPMLAASIENRLGEWRKEAIEISGDYKEIPIFKKFKKPPTFGSLRNKSFGIVAMVAALLKTIPHIDLKVCKHCNICVDSCPVGAIHRKTKQIDYNRCIECMCCHELCPHQAVKLRKSNPAIRFVTKLIGK